MRRTRPKEIHVRQPLRVPVTFALVVGAALPTGCESRPGTCSGAVFVGPEITVTDSATGKPVCDATVVARCSDAGFTLFAEAPDGFRVDAAISGCRYGGRLASVTECSVFTVTVSKPGYEPVTLDDVEVRHSTSCPGPAPDPQQRSVALKAL